MTLISQEADEEHFARLLFAILNMGPIQNLRRGEPAPDIVATLPSHIVGLEVTEIFMPHNTGNMPHQAVENYRTLLLTACRVEWHLRQCPHVEVHVHFNPSILIPKRQIGELASLLCDVVAANLPAEEGYVSLEFDWDRREAFLPEQITVVHVVRFTGPGESHWLAPDSDFVMPLTIELVQSTLNRKSLANYREPGAESWLLIVDDGRHISASFALSEAVLKHQYYAQFERMFLLELFSLRAYELHAA